MYSSNIDHGIGHLGQEPMTMGSPVNSPPQSQYLPGFLLGEHASAPSLQPRLWSTSSGASPSSSLNRSGSWTSPTSHGSQMSPTPKSETRARDLAGGRAKDKTVAPPVQSLFNHIASPAERNSFAGTPDGLPSEASSRLFSVTSPTPGTPANKSQLDAGVYLAGGPNQQSPTQLDPFYTQGEAISPDEVLDETWVTIFGFPSAATSYILQQFAQYGHILKNVVSSDGNWMHVQYQSKLQAKKALSKNSKVFGGSIMVGVTQCIDTKVMNDHVGDVSFNMSLTRGHSVHTPKLSGELENSGLNNSSRRVPIRPLTAAYRAASAENEVVQGSQTPHKSSNILSKAVEYVFGW